MVLQSYQVTEPGPYHYRDLGHELQLVEVLRFGDELVVRFGPTVGEEQGADVLLSAVSGEFEPVKLRTGEPANHAQTAGRRLPARQPAEERPMAHIDRQLSFPLD